MKNKKKSNSNKNRVLDEINKIISNPGNFILVQLKRFKNYVKDNYLFCLYVFINILNAFLLRMLTMKNADNFFAFQPILADFAFIIILGSFSFFFKKKGRMVFYCLSTIILTALCMINSAYYTFYTSFSSISLLSTVKFIGQVGDAVVENVLKPEDFIYILMPIIMIVTCVRKLKKEKQINGNNNEGFKEKTKAIRTLAFGVGSAIIFSMTLTSIDISRIAKQWNREYIVMKYGIYVYHINDLIKSLEPKITSLFGYDEAMRTFKEYYDTSGEVNTNKYTGIYEGKNIVAIHAESIQNFVIGLKINDELVAPNLTKLASGGMYFDNFYSQVSVGTSSDTEFTLNTSLMPSNSGTAFGSYADRTYISIPSLLKEKGYYNFAMHGNNADYWNRRIMHKNLGYDHFYAKSEYDIDEVIGLGLSDKSFFRQSIEKLKIIDKDHKNYYGNLLMLTNHTPFSETDKYGEFSVKLKKQILNEAGEYEEVEYQYMDDTKLGRYLQSVHYADAALGEFMQGMEEAGLLENTVIVLYGDHDARLPRGDYERLYNYNPETNDLLPSNTPGYIKMDSYQYELNRKVPFIIWTKDGKYKGTNSNVMGMYNVMPTLGNMFGFSNKYALGKDIFNIGEDNIVIFPTGNWVTNKVYYNSQKGEYLALNEVVITEEYIKECNDYADNLLNVSNSIIVYDLIKKNNEEQVNEKDVIEATDIK